MLEEPEGSTTEDPKDQVTDGRDLGDLGSPIGSDARDVASFRLHAASGIDQSSSWHNLPRKESSFRLELLFLVFKNEDRQAGLEGISLNITIGTADLAPDLPHGGLIILPHQPGPPLILPGDRGTSFGPSLLDASRPSGIPLDPDRQVSPTTPLPANPPRVELVLPHPYGQPGPTLIEPGRGGAQVERREPTLPEDLTGPQSVPVDPDQPIRATNPLPASPPGRELILPRHLAHGHAGRDHGISSERSGTGGGGARTSSEGVRAAGAAAAHDTTPGASRGRQTLLDHATKTQASQLQHLQQLAKKLQVNAESTAERDAGIFPKSRGLLSPRAINRASELGVAVSRSTTVHPVENHHVSLALTGISQPDAVRLTANNLRGQSGLDLSLPNATVHPVAAARSLTFATGFASPAANENLNFNTFTASSILASVPAGEIGRLSSVSPLPILPADWAPKAAGESSRASKDNRIAEPVQQATVQRETILASNNKFASHHFGHMSAAGKQVSFDTPALRIAGIEPLAHANRSATHVSRETSTERPEQWKPSLSLSSRDAISKDSETPLTEVVLTKQSRPATIDLQNTIHTPARLPSLTTWRAEAEMRVSDSAAPYTVALLLKPARQDNISLISGISIPTNVLLETDTITQPEAMAQAAEKESPSSVQTAKLEDQRLAVEPAERKVQLPSHGEVLAKEVLLVSVPTSQHEEPLVILRQRDDVNVADAESVNAADPHAQLAGRWRAASRPPQPAALLLARLSSAGSTSGATALPSTSGAREMESQYQRANPGTVPPLHLELKDTRLRITYLNLGTKIFIIDRRLVGGEQSSSTPEGGQVLVLSGAAGIAMLAARRWRRKRNDSDERDEPGEIGIESESSAAHLRRAMPVSRFSYMVQPGDTLNNLARAIWEDEAVAWLILELNQLEQVWEGRRCTAKLTLRQVIDFPIPQEVADYYRSGRHANHRDHVLVTDLKEAAFC